MAAEPEHPMDRELRAYAEARRKQTGGPFAMPPQTRQALCAAVDRQHLQATARSAGWWDAFWPYLTLGISAVATGLVVVWIWVDRHQEDLRRSELAKALPAQVAAPAASVAPSSREDDLAVKSPALVDAAVERVQSTLPMGEVIAPEAGPYVEAKPVTPALVRKLERDSPRPVTMGRGATARFAVPAPETPQLGVVVPSVTNLAQSVSDDLLALAAPVPAPVLAPSRIDGLAERTNAVEVAFAKIKKEVASAEQPQSTTASENALESGALGRPAAVWAEPEQLKPAVRSAISPGEGEARNVVQPVARAKTALSVLANEPRLGVRLLDARQDGAAAKDQKSYGLGLSAPRPSPDQSASPVPASSQQAGSWQRFVQSDGASRLRRNYNSPPRPQVLNDFHLQQNGSQVEIRDADGSLYFGSLRAPVELKGGAANAKPNSNPNFAYAPTDSLQAPQTNNLSQQFEFTVVGTNIALSQRVVFNGSLVMTNAKPLNEGALGGTGGFGGNQGLSNARVQGRAAVGTRTQIEVIAVPVSEGMRKAPTP